MNQGLVITLFPLVFPQFIFILEAQWCSSLHCCLPARGSWVWFQARILGISQSVILLVLAWVSSGGAGFVPQSKDLQGMRLLAYSKGAITLGLVDPCQVKARLPPLPLLTPSHREIMTITLLDLWLIYIRSVWKWHAKICRFINFANWFLWSRRRKRCSVI